MKIIKCGGSSLKKYEERVKIYNHIKELNDKVILVVSAFNDCPYSTNSLRKLIENNYTYYMQEELLACGEIISSIRVCNELLNNYIDAALIYKEEVGIYVSSSNQTDEILSLDKTYIEDKISKHQVVVVPGFIGINQDNKIVTLNKNGSDLTAVLIAKMFDIKEVTLFKDVLGLSSIDPLLSSNYKLYKSVSYELMSQIVMHGSNLIQHQAIKIAKENDINIKIVHYLSKNYETVISKFSNEKIIVFQKNENNIYIEGFVNKDLIENKMILNNVDYEYILPFSSYLKIVCNNNVDDTLQSLHKMYLKGEL